MLANLEWPKWAYPLLQLVRGGSSVRHAAAEVGASRFDVDLYVSRCRGARATPAERSFAREYESALASRVGTLERAVYEQAKEDYRPATWMLSHIAPEEYGEGEQKWRALFREAVRDVVARTIEVVTEHCGRAVAELVRADLGWTDGVSRGHELAAAHARDDTDQPGVVRPDDGEPGAADPVPHR